MARRPRKRRRRHAAAVGAVAAAGSPDCFSHLNDDLLRIIVSRLPVRSAASLAAASRHFRAQVPPLIDRVDSLTLHEPHFPVALHDAPPLRLRRLAVAPHAAIPPSSFRPILQTAAGHGVSEISVRLPRRSRLPKNVFSVRSLAALTLDTCAVPRWSVVVCPCLRTLRLRHVAIHQETINSIIASASCLETLEMTYCTGHGSMGGGCTVESSSVRNLVFRPVLKQEEATIRATGLRTVTLHTRSKARRLELAPAPEVRKAYLHIAKARNMESFRVRPFLDAGTKLNSLTLRCQAMKLLSSEYEDIPKLRVTFRDLRILSVSLNLSSDRELVFLLKLLERCPNLQQFALSAAEKDNENTPPAQTDNGNRDNDNTLPPPCFTDHKERLANIPCLTCSLMRFKFIGFKPEEYQKKLMVFLLTRAKNLKKVGVEFEKSQAAAVKEILSVRRALIQRTSNKYTGYYTELEYS
uniref:F-box domain-containing protein n=1 Tax=Arundo donax TaxID=35708 RepID=A0A0A8YQ53_ARUDO